MWLDVNHTTATPGACDEKIIRQIKKGEYGPNTDEEE
jgi:hypothetical protein